MADEGESAPAGTRGERFRVLAPWLVCLTICGGGAVTLDGLERAIAVGAFSASCVGALVAVSQLRGTIVSMRRWMGDRESALSTFADDRAAAVARQFQWGGEGVVSRAAAIEALTLDWTLEYDSSGHSLRLRTTSDVRPSKARIVDATGRLVTESVGTLHRRPAQLLLRVPQSVAAAVESGDWSSFHLEV